MSRKLPPFSAVKAFEAAARHGSFARAAQELSVTSTAISQHVKGLEAWLGEPLFVRRANKVILTDAGERFLPDVSRLLDALGALLPPKQADEALISLTVALPASLSDGWLRPSLHDFYSANPSIEILIQDTIKSSSPPHLESLDFLITDKLIDQPGFVCDPLFDDAIVPVCTMQYRDLLGLQDPHNWKSVTLLHDAHCETDWAMWGDQRGSVRLDWHGGLRYPNQWLAMEAAKQGRGIFMAHSVCAKQAQANGQLIAMSNAPLPTGKTIYLVRRRGHIGPAAIQFRAWIVGQLGQA